MRYKFWAHQVLIIITLAFSGLSLTAQDLDAGKGLFRANCAACHAADMKTKLTGPPLAGIQEAWADHGGDEALYSWIRNSQAMVSEGSNERANQVWAEYGPVVMNSFPTLTDDEIANIIAYINGVADGVYPPKKEDDNSELSNVNVKKDNTWLYFGLAALLAIMALVLTRIVSNLNYMIKVKETGAAAGEPQTLKQTLTSRAVIGFIVFALVVIGGYYTVNNAISLGRQQGYQPTQPIKFSHKTHAGDQQIDCQYCHDGARRSKHSIIPAANTCMNCHKAIKTGSTYGTAELTKIFASVGYDPSTDKYISNYDQLSNKEIAEIFKPWIAENNDDVDVDDQWEDIADALMDESIGDDKIAGPINWVRIHSLPDHVYFNHSQHVTAGQLECQTCHGPVEEMEVLEQHSPLSMGWCVNCHRETEVKFADNEYYKNYELYHKELTEGTRKKVTVEDIGGLECQKCHY